MNAYVPCVTYAWRTWKHIYMRTYPLWRVYGVRTGMACLGVVVPGSCCFCCCCSCFLHITTYLMRVLTDDDCCTDEGTPPPCAPSAWLNNEIHVVGGWCYCTHLFGVETNAGTQNKWKNRQRSSLMQFGVWPLEDVCHAPHSQPSSNEGPDVGAKRRRLSVI